MNAGLGYTLLSLAVLGVFALVTWAGYSMNSDIRGGIEGVGSQRDIKVVFNADVTDGMPLRFYPVNRTQVVNLNEEGKNTYILENLSDRTYYIRPIHSVAPADVARAFSMTVCFCFNDQKIGPYEKVEYPVHYVIDESIAERTATGHINYRLHRIDSDNFRPPVGVNTTSDVDALIEAAKEAR